MSLREEFLQAQKDGYQSKIEADKKKISDTLGKFAGQIETIMTEMVRLARTGNVLTDRQKEPLSEYVSCETLPLAMVQRETLEALPGYRRLHETCRSPQVDICLKIETTGSYKDRFGNPLAYFNMTLDPLKGFDASELTITGKDNQKPVVVSIRQPLPADNGEKAAVTKLNL